MSKSVRNWLEEAAEFIPVYSRIALTTGEHIVKLPAPVIKTGRVKCAFPSALKRPSRPF
jgi:hypothetical protein